MCILAEGVVPLNVTPEMYVEFQNGEKVILSTDLRVDEKEKQEAREGNHEMIDIDTRSIF